MNQPFFREEFASTFEAMSETLDHAVEALLEEHWIRPADEPCARLCLEEALVNAVRHGNNNDARLKVLLEMVSCGDRCKIKVHDEGNGFRPEDIKMPQCSELGGRGIVLIRHYMDQVHYLQNEHCLEMILRRKAS